MQMTARTTSSTIQAKIRFFNCMARRLLSCLLLLFICRLPAAMHFISQEKISGETDRLLLLPMFYNVLSGVIILKLKETLFIGVNHMGILIFVIPLMLSSIGHMHMTVKKIFGPVFFY